METENDSDLRNNNRSKSNFGGSVLYGKVLALWSRLEEKSVYWGMGTLCEFGHFASLGQHQPIAKALSLRTHLLLSSISRLLINFLILL